MTKAVAIWGIILGITSIVLNKHLSKISCSFQSWITGIKYDLRPFRFVFYFVGTVFIIVSALFLIGVFDAK